MDPEARVLKLHDQRLEEGNALPARGFESIPSGGGELEEAFLLVVVFLWVLASAAGLMNAERRGWRGSAWILAGSYATASFVAALLLRTLLGAA